MDNSWWRTRPMNPAEKAWFITEIEYLRECFSLTPAWPSPLRLEAAERARLKAAVEEIKARFIQKFGRS